MSKETTMTDACGAAIPLRHVKPYDRLRDKRSRRILARWQKARAYMEQVYRETAEDLAAIENAAGEGRYKVALGTKGNFQAMSFDGLIQVGKRARYELRFDERLATAQQIIEDVIREKAEGVDPDLAEIVKGVFRPTSDGLLSQSRVLSLFRLKISHPRWRQAMDLIRESIESKRGKTLFFCNFKPTREADWQSILLDIAAISPESADEQVTR